MTREHSPVAGTQKYGVIAFCLWSCGAAEDVFNKRVLFHFTGIPACGTTMKFKRFSLLAYISARNCAWQVKTKIVGVDCLECLFNKLPSLRNNVHITKIAQNFLAPIFLFEWDVRCETKFSKKLIKTSHFLLKSVFDFMMLLHLLNVLCILHAWFQAFSIRDSVQCACLRIV